MRVIVFVFLKSFYLQDGSEDDSESCLSNTRYKVQNCKLIIVNVARDVESY
jgi:uncharacterized membrane protein